MNFLSKALALLLLGFFLSISACGQETLDNNPLLPNDDQEKKLLESLDKMRSEQRHYNVSDRDGRMLRLLTEAINAQRVVEIGTSTGESAIWFAMALQKTGGHLYTHEIDSARARLARKNFEKAGVDERITVITGDAHEKVTNYKKPIDIVFLDADKSGYPDYLKKLLPVVKPGGLIIAHNMNYPEPDPQYIEAITQNPELETQFLFMDEAGLGVTLKKR